MKAIATKRLENESARAYAAFKFYAEMGAQRSIAATRQKLGKSQDLLERWSRKYEWVKRAALWDNEQAEREMSAADKAAAILALEQQKLRIKVQKKAAEWFDKLQAKADQMVSFPLEEKTVTQKDDKGNAVAVTVNPINWRMSDLRGLIELADHLGRLAAGMPSKVTGLSGPEGKPFTIPQAQPQHIQQYVVRIGYKDKDERDSTERLADDIVKRQSEIVR